MYEALNYKKDLKSLGIPVFFMMKRITFVYGTFYYKYPH